MKILYLVAVLLLLSSANAVIYQTIDSFFTSAPPLALIVANGGATYGNSEWYSPYYVDGSGNGGPPTAVLYIDTAEALGGQRDAILGYESSTPTNSVAIISIVADAASVAFPLSYNGGAYFQWDGDDTGGDLSAVFPGARLNSSPGIGALGGSMDFTFQGRAFGVSIDISADHDVQYSLRLIDSADNLNRFTFDVFPITEESRQFFFIRFDDSNWENLAFDFTDVRGFEVVVLTFDGSATNNAIDTDFKFLNIFGFEVSGRVYIDCLCDTDVTNDAAVNGAVVNLFDRGSVTPLDTTTTDSTGFYLFDSAIIDAGLYTVCLDDQSNTLCPTFTNCLDFELILDDQFNDATGLDFSITVDSTLSIPEDATVECGECTTPECLGFATISGCGGGDLVVTDFDDTNTVSGCNFIISRRWVNPENPTQVGVQVITIIDSFAPVIIIEAQDRSVTCDSPSTYTDFIATQAGADATDCTSFIWTASANAAPVRCDFETVTFTATDPCGNFAVTTATYTVTDFVAPVFNPQASDDRAECDLKTGSSDSALNQYVGTRGGSSVTDDCASSGALTFSNDFVGFASDCDGSEQIIFTASDGCGNTASTTGTFRINDTTAPVITIQPADLNLNCNAGGSDSQFQAWLDSRGGAQATDACIADDGDLIWTNDNVGGQLNSCSDNGSVTFTVTDNCGFFTSAVASYALSDNTPPSITNAAAPLVVQCDGNGNVNDFNTWISTNAGATATDACGNVSFSNDNTGAPIECGQSVSVTFTAFDDCSGLSAATTASYTVVDNVAPFFVVDPQSVSEECTTDTELSFDNWLSANAFSSISDDCSTSGLTTTNDFTGNFAVFCNNAVSVRFFANDPCGNSSPAQTATFTVVDTIAPVISPQASSVFEECDLTQSQSAYTTFLSTRGGAEATDSCGTVTWTNDGPTAVPSGCDESAIVTFTANDGCGNTSTTVATFQITDTTPPTLSREATDISVECTSNGNDNDLNNWLNSNGGAAATDTCGAVTFSNNFVALSGGCVSSADVTFTGCDPCGQCVSTFATFTASDTRPPTINPQAQNRIVECDPNANNNQFQDYLDDFGGASAFDDCNPDGLVFSNTFVTSPSGCNEETVTFIVTDACGQTASTTATFQILDSVAPTFSVPPADLVVECDGAGNTSQYSAWVASFGGAVAEDACAITLAFTTNAANAGPVGCGTEVVAFTVEDECGNAITRTASFRVEDTIAPTFSPAASDLAVECDLANNLTDLDAWLAANGNAQAFDSCYGTNVVFTNSFTVLTPNVCGSSATVDFRAVDPCGQAGVTTATFTVVDNQAPVITQQASTESFECNDATNAGQISNYIATRGGAVATDSCSGVIWTNDFTTDPVECAGPVSVTFTATDACGNQSFTFGSISIDDTVAPSFTNFPADRIIRCDDSSDPSVTGRPGVADACASDLTASFTDISIVLPDERLCPGDTVITRTWTTFDDCGNVSIEDQTITITLPVGECIPTPCPPCGDQTCCASSLEPVPCTPVGCNAVPCLTTDCASVPCIPVVCDTGSATPIFTDDDDEDDDDIIIPAQSPDPFSCQPIYIYVFDDDEDNTPEVVQRSFDGSSSSPASMLSISFFALVAFLVLLI